MTTKLSSNNPVAPLEHLIEERVIAPLQAEAVAASCLAAFVTGSYAHGQHDRKNPNINIYFLVRDGDGPTLRMRLGLLFPRIRQALQENGVDFCVDCHPYTVSYRATGCQSAITLTSKVMEHGAARPWSLPPTIGQLWLTRWRLLAGDAGSLDELARDISADADWFQAIHEALSRYKNLLDHLPWALDWTRHPELLAEESLRYAEEAMKDALTIALTPNEINGGIRTELYLHWAEGAAGCLTERFGADGLRLTTTVAAMKERFRSSQPWTIEEAQSFWETALEVWSFVWSWFQRRVSLDAPISDGWIRRVNAFV